MNGANENGLWIGVKDMKVGDRFKSNQNGMVTVVSDVWINEWDEATVDVVTGAGLRIEFCAPGVYLVHRISFCVHYTVNGETRSLPVRSARVAYRMKVALEECSIFASVERVRG